MDGENIITWNLANWITIILMVAIGYVIYGLVGNVARNKIAATPASSTTS